MSQKSTLTFLFTDIEGSTRLWESQPELMRPALARHDAILRTSIDLGGGIVFKTVGEAFCAVFMAPAGAVQAALEAQLLLAAEKWALKEPIRVRIAIHTGEAECRDEDYFGPPLSRVARLLALAHGGQTLLSESAYALVQESRHDEVTFKDLGEHRLRDLQRPEHVFQMMHPTLQGAFGLLPSLDTLPNNLPQRLTTFVGREREMREIKRILASAQMLTLTGSGGTGKTRLGLQVAADLLEASGDGTWVVELAAVSDPSLVPQTIASVLGIWEEPGRRLVETLIEHFRAKRLLLLLDHADPVLEALADIVDQVLPNCPQLQILATCREALQVNGEQIYRVPSLSMPNPSHRYAQETLGHFEAVKLFVDRAVLAKPTFQVTNHNAGSIAQLCHRLDGIPLAIELAAARVSALSVERISELLDERFQVFAGATRTKLPRHQTLRATIDWSYALLSDNEKQLLCRVSVFSDGWGSESARQVCAKVEDDSDAIDVLDLLSLLVEKSLAIYDDVRQRYRIAETVKTYARNALAELHETVAIRNQHLEFFVRLAEECENLILGPQAVEALAILDVEQKNLRAAIDWGLDGGDPIQAIRLANSLAQFFQMRGEYTEAIAIYRSCLAKAPIQAKLERAVALAVLGILGFRLTQFEAAREPLIEALKLYSEIGDESGAAKVQNTLGVIALQLGEFDEAARWFDQALPVVRLEEDPVRLAVLLNNMAILAIQNGSDLERARKFYNEALTLNRKVGNRAYQAGNLSNLADLSFKEGDAETARQLAREACEMQLELGDMQNLQDSVEVLAPAELALGRPRIAAMLIATKESVMEQLGGQVAPYVLEEYQRNVSAIRAALGDAEFEAITARGRLMTLEDAYRASLQD